MSTRGDSKTDAPAPSRAEAPQSRNLSEGAYDKHALQQMRSQNQAKSGKPEGADSNAMKQAGQQNKDHVVADNSIWSQSDLNRGSASSAKAEGQQKSNPGAEESNDKGSQSRKSSDSGAAAGAGGDAKRQGNKPDGDSNKTNGAKDSNGLKKPDGQKQNGDSKSGSSRASDSKSGNNNPNDLKAQGDDKASDSKAENKSPESKADGDKSKDTKSQETKKTTDPRVPFEGQNANPKMEDYTLKPGDTRESIAREKMGDFKPAREGYASALSFANKDSDMKPGDQIKLPEVKDGVISAKNEQGATMRTNPENGAFDSYNPQTKSGEGTDSLGRNYRSQLRSDGSVLRRYNQGGGSESIDPDGKEGVGTDSTGRAYQLRNNTDGSQNRTYVDNGAQEKLLPNGDSYYRGARPEDPSQPVFESTNKQGDITSSRQISKSENTMSIDDAMRKETVDRVGDGGLIAQGKAASQDWEANNDLFKDTARNEYERAGGGAKGVQSVDKMLSQIQDALKTQDPSAKFEGGKDVNPATGNTVYNAKETFKTKDGKEQSSLYFYDLPQYQNTAR